MNEVRNQTGGPMTSALPEGTPILPYGLKRDNLVAGLLKAGDKKHAEEELNDLEASWPGIVARMFPREDPRTGEKLGAYEEQCIEVQKSVASVVLNFLQEPYVGSRGSRMFENMMTDMLQASLLGDPVDRLPAYTGFKQLVLMTSSTKDFYEARSGIDPIVYEDPISRSEAYNFDPAAGGGSRVVNITGNSSTVYPYFKETPKHALSFWEMMTRQIKPIVIVKRQITQELAKGWDDDLITHFDAVVPDGTLYTAHALHITTLASNAAGAVTRTIFLNTGQFLLHVDSASGVVHAATPGAALCDILALRDIRDWGSDVWTEEEVSEFTRKGFGTRYDESVVVGKEIDGFSLLQTPIEKSAANRKVRFFARRQQVGYWIPVTINGSQILTQVGPMRGDDPDVNAVRNVTTPPGFTFTIQAWEPGAIQIVNPYALAKINHT